ncbi:MAG: glycerol-phosphatase [Frankiales bacterium]|nr:glycerol-phosphatase [Frankiales bacterium]
MSQVAAAAPSGPLIDEYDALLVDLDGVVYAGGSALPHAVEVLSAVRARGVPLAFVTNNASRTPEAVAALLVSIGLAASADEVATSAQAAARLLAARFDAGAPVLVIGGEGLQQAVRAVGLRPVSEAEGRPVAVVQGYGPEVGWRDLAEASVAVRSGAYWVATNLDLTIPSDRGILPGNGTLVAAVAAALGRQPDEIAGKPAPPLHHESVLRTGGASPLVVGDRLDTDIAGANAVGADSLLVLTGVSGPSELVAAAAEERPTHVTEDLRGLLHPAEAVVTSAAHTRCGGWRAELEGAVVRVSGEGSPVDALRAVLPLAWKLVDAARQPELRLPAVLATWWRPR